MDKTGRGLPSIVSLKESDLNIKALKLLSEGSLSNKEITDKLKEGIMKASNSLNSLLSLSIDDLIVMKWEITEKGEKFLKEHSHEHHF